ncbi:hypothetical protein D5085_02305 [Ectothiorhodospiraceae bacterium BW-2]|nr:hypothetical protein D5085_02305 [Ectothiorhodospiraceae bacterium BW-2]
MQVTLDLPDDVGRELKALANPELFVTDLIRAARQSRKPTQKRPLGALKGRMKVTFQENFKMTDEEFLQS